MDSALPPLQPTPIAPRRSRLPLVIGAIIPVAVAVLLAWWLLPKGPSQPGQTPEDLAAQQAAQAAFDASNAQQMVGNLDGIHKLITTYYNQHKAYPQHLSDLTNITGYAPSAARDIAEAKLDNGQPAYTYTLADGTYQLCANQKDAEPKCEGPKE